MPSILPPGRPTQLSDAEREALLAGICPGHRDPDTWHGICRKGAERIEPAVEAIVAARSVHDPELLPRILRVIQRTADAQGNVTMIQLAENIVRELRSHHD